VLKITHFVKFIKLVSESECESKQSKLQSLAYNYSVILTLSQWEACV
jgi:hypothetical protein